MKKLSLLLTAVLLVAGLSGCAAKTYDGAKVKCPACGHEFMMGDPKAG